MTKIEALQQIAREVGHTGEMTDLTVGNMFRAMDLYAESWIAELRTKKEEAERREIEAIQATTRQLLEWQDSVLRRLQSKAMPIAFTVFSDSETYDKGWYVVMVHNDTVPMLVLHDPVSPNNQWYTGGFTYRKLPMKNGMRMMKVPV